LRVPPPRFEFVPHTADLAVRLRAASLPSLFETAGAALVEALTDPAAVRPAEERTLSVEAPDADLLLVDWLHELLFLFETEGFLLSDARVTIERHGLLRLTATIWGERRDDSRHPIKVLIKAVTYHGLEIVQRDGGYEVTVIFDL
jgi:SHS2 domain-containing protein